MKRHNQILTGILVVQIIISVIVFWPRAAEGGSGEPLFPDLEINDVVSLSVTDSDGNSTALSKIAGNWVITEADDYPADGTKIDTLLEGISSLTGDRLVTTTESSHRQLQVAPDDFLRRIDFQTSEGDRFIIYLGSSPSYGASHFRVAGQNEAYLTDELSAFDISAAASAWIDPLYVDIPLTDVVRVTLENENGSFVFRQDEEGNWSTVGLAEGETLAETRVTATIRQAASVRMARPLGLEEQASYGMDDPSAIVTLETADATITLTVGALDSLEETYVVKSSESPYYVSVNDFNMSNLVENSREDFVELAPEPTPEG
jgi:hypothetical protein